MLIFSNLQIKYRTNMYLYIYINFYRWNYNFGDIFWSQNKFKSYLLSLKKVTKKILVKMIESFKNKFKVCLLNSILKFANIVNLLLIIISQKLEILMGDTKHEFLLDKEETSRLSEAMFIFSSTIIHPYYYYCIKQFIL